jgi:hypothetical protein
LLLSGVRQRKQGRAGLNLLEPLSTLTHQEEGHLLRFQLELSLAASTFGNSFQGF